jgi:hypothetical protein
MVDALVKVPDLTAHIRTMVRPGSRLGDSGGKRGKNADSPAPLNVTAVTDVDDLHYIIADVATRIVEGTGLVGPSWAGSDVRPASKRLVLGEVAYSDARVVGVHRVNRGATVTVAQWLLDHIEWPLSQDWAPSVIDDVTHTVNTLAARWPTIDRPTRLPVHCPHCRQRALIRTVPTEPGWPAAITCQECRVSVLEAEYAAHLKETAAEAHDARIAAARAARRQATEVAS